jgi:hypothetical protein
MLHAIYEPKIIDSLHRISPDIESNILAGTFVMKDPQSTVGDELIPSDGTDYWGILAQDVYLNPGSTFARPHLNFQAYSGDQVGVYTTAGYFKTDRYVEGGDYEPGAELYISEDGILTDDAPDNDPVSVGRVVSMDSDGLLVFYFRGL